MEEILQTYNNAFFRYFIIFFLGAVIFVFLRYLFYWTRKFKRCSFLKKTISLIVLTNYKPKALHLCFGDKEINDVIVTRIAVWNSGTETINGESDKVFITTKNEEETSILDCKVEDIESGRFKTIKKDRKEKYFLPLNGLREKEGYILQIVHTGDANNLLLDFQIVEGKRTIEIDNNKHILSVNGEKLWIRKIWAKIVHKTGFRPEGYKNVIVFHELFISLIYAILYYLFDGPIDNIIDRLVFFRPIDILRAMLFFALLDILLLIIGRLLLQKIPDGLSERL